MTTPADELRTAAEKLHELTSDTTPSPWWAEHPEERWGEQKDARVVSSRGTLAILASEENGHLNADYIAAMDPSVGTALADWLEATADQRDRLAALFEEPVPDPNPDCALAVARAINGTTR
ncbi:hypothetical protein ACGF5F_32505 [Streptomyces sp. NPDC047821]|uniref:hypothetical protein n=1 Tax=Streptomyces sp. NPDC047821 TaxID=3365488 RepID=UPI00371A7F1D